MKGINLLGADVSRPVAAHALSRLAVFSVLLLVISAPENVSSLFAQSAQPEDPTIAALRRGESTYFTAKMQNLSEQLYLDDNQQKRLRPIAEQETAYLEQIRLNPVLSRKDKIQRLRRIIRDSDNQMKEFLSAQQWEKLKSLRRDQKDTLAKYLNEK